MKSIFKITLFFLILVLLTAYSYAYEMQNVLYWYSESQKVFFWSTTPSISRSYIDGDNTSYMILGYNNAIYQWNTLAGMSLNNYNAYPSNTDIKCWEGEKETLNSYFGVSLDEETNGFTTSYYSNTSIVYLNYYGATMRRYTTTSARVLIEDTTQSESEYRHVYTHELGHALGWDGHSPSTSDVMYYSTSLFTLSNRDKTFITQFYL